jgi:hypothetical protein
MRFALYGMLGLLVACVGMLLLWPSAGPQPDAAASSMIASAAMVTAFSPAIPLTGEPPPTAPALPTPAVVGPPALERQALQIELRATLTALQKANRQARTELKALQKANRQARTELEALARGSRR